VQWDCARGALVSTCRECARRKPLEVSALPATVVVMVVVVVVVVVVVIVVAAAPMVPGGIPDRMPEVLASSVQCRV
jgi:hypothetical protein